VFADTLGHVRHIVVNSNGDVYVNTWSGSYYSGPTHAGGFLVALRDTNNDGKADIVRRFGPDAAHRNEGGTGIGIFSGGLYAEEGDTLSKRIVRYAISADSLAPSSPSSEIVVNGLPANGDHPMHPFVIDAGGSIYMDVGSATNSCQAQNRTLNSPGRNPCTELRTRAGIWRYDANKKNQRFSPAERHATGIRNAVGVALDGSGQLYATMHGRDQLYDNWPKLYSPEEGQNQPAEELLKIEKGGDYGWPYCYYDNVQRKLIQAPEYGGDGKQVGNCDSKKGPEAFFPAHWAPDGLLIYTGSQFPSRYKAALSSRSTDRGTAHPARSRGTTSRSFHSAAGSPPIPRSMRSSPTDLPADPRTPIVPNTGPPA
jgi:glucose/arabinose dehydrogenase